MAAPPPPAPEPPPDRVFSALRRMTLFGFYSGLSSLLGANVSADRRGGAADSSIASAAGAPTLCSVGALGGDAHSEGEFLVLRSLVTRAQVRALHTRGFFVSWDAPVAAVCTRRRKESRELLWSAAHTCCRARRRWRSQSCGCRRRLCHARRRQPHLGWRWPLMTHPTEDRRWRRWQLHSLEGEERGRSSDEGIISASEALSRQQQVAAAEDHISS